MKSKIRNTFVKIYQIKSRMKILLNFRAVSFRCFHQLLMIDFLLAKNKTKK